MLKAASLPHSGSDHDSLPEVGPSALNNSMTDTLEAYAACFQEPLMLLDAGANPGLAESGRTGISGKFVCHHLPPDSVQANEPGRGDTPWKLPYPDNHFDVIIARELVEYHDNPQLLISEIYRIAKPGALIMVIVTVHSSGFDRLKRVVRLADSLTPAQTRPERHRREMSFNATRQLLRAGNPALEISARRFGRLPGFSHQAQFCLEKY